MNRFDHFFFAKYVPEGEEVRAVYHRHIIAIVDDVFVWLFFGVFLPVLFYLHNSFRIADFVPLYYFEGFLAAIWGILMWRVLDWYNDVWIVTNKSIVDLDWTPTKQNVVTLSFENIEGIEAKEKTIIDNLLNRGDVIIHCIGSQFVLDDAWAPGKIVSEIRATTEERRNNHHETSFTPAPQASEFELLVDALKDIVRERMDAKRVAAMEQESFRPQLEGALSQRGTIDLRPDDQKWEHYQWKPKTVDPLPGVLEGNQSSLIEHSPESSFEDSPAEDIPAEPFPEESEEEEKHSHS